MAVIEKIYLAEREGSDMLAVERAEAVADVGLVGDRYARPGNVDSPECQVTLIEAEAVEAFVRDLGLPLGPDEPRRNLVTRGVALNDLCGRRFHVGDVELEGIELCEPCATFARRTHQEVVRFFVHRGGLRARVVAGGVLRVGDPVMPAGGAG